MPAHIFRKILPNLPPVDPNSLGRLLETVDYPKDEFRGDLTSFDDYEAIPLLDEDQQDPEGRPLSKEEAGATEALTRQAGLDVLAFYKSYRDLDKRPFLGKWGVFFVNRGVRHLTQMLEIEYPQLINPRKIAIEFLWHHEVFHAKFDVAVLGFEAFSNSQLYVPQKMAFTYRESQQPEEALANLSAYNFVRGIDAARKQNARAQTLQVPGISSFFYSFMKLQPGAYARFDEPRHELESETAAGIFRGIRHRQARCDELSYWIGLVPPRTCHKSDIPRHLVVGVDYRGLISPARFIPSVNEVRETERFLKELAPGQETFWKRAKSKLTSSSCLPGLDFKFWEAPATWSMRVNDNFRAHLTPLSLATGVWQAESFGGHKKMGHG